jgi:hypothetical protein
MEQVAIITKLVQELIAMNKPIDVESVLGEFVSSLEQKVARKKEQREWSVRWEEGRVEREKRLVIEKARAEREAKRVKEERNERRRELYQLKKAEKK